MRAADSGERVLRRRRPTASGEKEDGQRGGRALGGGAQRTIRGRRAASKRPPVDADADALRRGGI